MLKYIKKFNFSILVFISISLFFSLEISKIEVVRMNSLEENNFFSSDSIIFHLKSSIISTKDFFKIISSEKNLMIQKSYIEDGGLRGQALYLSDDPKNSPNILEGRYFKKEDFVSNTPVAVIGKDIANRTIKENGKEFLMINNLKYRVIGIMGGEDSLSNNKFIVNLNSYLLNYEKVIDMNDFYQVEWINYSTEVKFSELKEKIKNIDSNGILIEDNSRTIKNPIMNYIKYRAIYIIIIVAVFLLNIISITAYYINKNEKKTGVLKALGITNRIIIRKIVLEYELVSLISFIIGIAIHFIIYELFYINHIYYKIHLENVLVLIMCSIIIGLIASICPTLRLLKIEPNEIMKR